MAHRWLGLFLIPCFIADPILAARLPGYITAERPTRSQAEASLFSEQTMATVFLDAGNPLGSTLEKSRMNGQISPYAVPQKNSPL
jgi:hypothetical protein